MKKILLMCFVMIQLQNIDAQITAEINVKIEFVDDSYDGYQNFAKQAAKYLERVIRSQVFKEELLSLEMGKTQRKTNKQIYQLILKGIEKQCSERVTFVELPNQDCPKRIVDYNYKCPENRTGEINLKVRAINDCDGEQWLDKNCELDSSDRTIGIDGNGDGVTAICPQRLNKWFENKRIDYLAGHYMHEYMHILGFSHKGIGKYKSAVYKIGNLIERLVIVEVLKDNYDNN